MKYLFSGILAGACSILFYQCNGDTAEGDASTPSKGEVVYNAYCSACHGSDGKLQLNEASDLTTSTLSKEEIVHVVTNGREMMTPYKAILSEEEIVAVADFAKNFQR